ncbi:hypothetical protein IVB47_18760, partial [Bradyrhizobium sp. 62]|nr:hypothetical protein [Bradyrhizobium sp. 62]
GHDRRHLICVIAGSHSAMVAATAAPQPATGSPKLHEIALVAGGDTLTRTGAILFEVLPICVAHRAVGFWRHV